jgi:hypothetical protein
VFKPEAVLLEVPALMLSKDICKKLLKLTGNMLNKTIYGFINNT